MCDRSRLKFDERLAFTCPPALRSAVRRAAATHMQTPSEYLRALAYRGVVADGFPPEKGN
jgi:hypothetical protein